MQQQDSVFFHSTGKRRLPPAAELLPATLDAPTLAAVPTDYLLNLQHTAHGKHLRHLVEMLRAPRIAALPVSWRRKAYDLRKQGELACVVPPVPLKVLRLAYRLGRLRLPPGIDPYTPPTPTPS